MVEWYHRQYCFGVIDISIRGIELLDDRKSPRFAVLLLVFLLGAFLLDNLVFGALVRGITGNYLLPSLMWICIAFYVYNLPVARSSGRIRQRRLLRYLALLCAGIAVLAAMLQGALGGFGRSPYDHSLLGILINTLTLGSFLAAMELSRSWLMNRFFREKPLVGIPLIAVVFMLFSFPFNKLSSLHTGLALTEFFGMNFFPELGENLLATYLVFLGGPVPALIYRGALTAMEWFSPVLPQSNWITATLIGTLAPVLGLMLVQQIYREESGEEKKADSGESGLGWLFTSVACILVIWFCVGVFSYSPRVILSGSMRPVIDIGDVVIVKEIPGEETQLGDIIMFPVGDMKVTHRIIDVSEDRGQKFFQTKGDNNGSPDSDLVSEKEVMGKVIMIIPKAGWLTIMLRGGA